MKTELKVKLISHTPEPERLIAAAAKLCYSQTPASEIMDNLTDEQVDKFLNVLMNMGHASPIEHVNFIFAVEGVASSLTHQLVGHRHMSYSQKSQRYVTEGDFDYIVPPEIAADPFSASIYGHAMLDAQHAYDELVVRLICSGRTEKEACEDARYVLPNACETKIVVTMNVRELLHFFNVRGCNRAQWEIRELAYQMWLLCLDVAPNLFKNAGPSCLNGKCPDGAMSCGKSEEVRNKWSS